MLYNSAQEWRDAPEKRLLLFGMSGLGKTHVSDMLRATGKWFHYSVDYRIGTRYMGEAISDSLKREAMKIPRLRELLMTDSVRIRANITFGNLAPLAAHLGKPGDPGKGGMPWEEYVRRQGLHRDAERAAMLDTGRFAARAAEIYGYPHFVCDTSGSICEIVTPEDPGDPILSALEDQVLMAWIEGSDRHAEELSRRFDKAPKPMCFTDGFLAETWEAYLAEAGCTPGTVDPDAFLRRAYAKALAHRQPRYRAMAENWGVTISADAVAAVETEDDVIDLVAEALGQAGA